MAERSIPGTGGHDAVVYVAEAIDDPPIFEERARIVAEALGTSALDVLPAYYHNAPPKPAALAGTFERLGQWMYVCQQAIFEIFYQLGPSSIATVQGVAFGSYDWTQITAIRTLCRFARAGIQAESLVDAIAAHLEALRYEALLPAVADLCATQVKTPTLKHHLAARIQAFMAEEDPADALYLIEQYAYPYPEDARQYRAFILGLVQGRGLAGRHPILDGGILVEQEDGETSIAWSAEGPPPQDIHAIRAALLWHRIGGDPAVVRPYLKRWQATHPDEPIRAHISALLQQP